MATTGRIAASGNTVQNIEQAASLLAHIRKSAQELFYSVAVDDSGKILEIHKYTKGQKSAASLDFTEVVGRVFNVDGVKKVYLAHNHPSGDPHPSVEDGTSMEKISSLLRLKDIDTEALVISGQAYSNITPGTPFVSSPIEPSLRKTFVPEKERIIQRFGPPGDVAQNSKQVREIVQNKYGGKSGFVFFDAKLQDIGFMPYTKGQRTKDFASKIIAKGEELNSMGMAYYSSEPLVTVTGDAAAKERRGALRTLKIAMQGSLQLFDVVDSKYSMADSGLLPSSANVLETIDAINKLNTETALYQLGKSIPVVGNETLVDVLRKAPPLKGATLGLSDDGSIWVRNKSGMGFNVKSVTHIEADKVALELGHGKMMLENGEFIKGKSEGTTIELQRDMADEWTATHETLHQMKKMGLITKFDESILENHVKGLQKKGKWDSEERKPGSEEDWVKYATEFMQDRSIKGPAGRVLQKIADLVDMFVNIFKRTAKGVLRDIESGKMFEGKAKEVNEFAQAPSYTLAEAARSEEHTSELQSLS